jgi:hypothetical protein
VSIAVAGPLRERSSASAQASGARRVSTGAWTRGIEQTAMQARAGHSHDGLDLENEPLAKPPHAGSARVWVRYGGMAIRAEAELVAWTSTAASVPVGHPERAMPHRAWVWRRQSLLVTD